MRLKLILLITTLTLLSAGSIVAQSRQTRQEYVARYKDIAIAHMEKYGIPASITMAQGILESDSGNSKLSTSSNNHFGIKCKSNWSGRTVSYDDDAKGECFRAYPTVEESYEDHAIFLDTSPRYDSLFAYSSSDYKSWARGLKAAGYATAPHYATLLIKIIEEEQLYLLDRDNGDQLYAERNIGDGGKSHSLSEEAVDSGQMPVYASPGGYIDPDNHSVTINSHRGYNIERCNALYFTRAKRGDTIASIAEAFEMWQSTLRRFNDLDRDVDQLEEGAIIFIERKARSWSGDDKQSCQVQYGQTLYSISQEYGVRLKNLRRLNDMNRNEEVRVNQIIKLK
ncbi:MAG: glucosaminidase domain-containing protein [Rikenellaceae bacterium]